MGGPSLQSAISSLLIREPKILKHMHRWEYEIEVVDNSGEIQREESPCIPLFLDHRAHSKTLVSVVLTW